MNARPAIEISISKRTANAVLEALAYFHVFRYPLLKDEIKKFLRHSPDHFELDQVLDFLVGQKMIFLVDGFYSLSAERVNAERRKSGNARAERLMPRAARIARRLYSFPFVTGVAVSGSLSKNYADEKADIDFFIITKANRLWIARSCMHLFKKLTYLTGSQHLYCMNYFVDETSLRIEDENIYTATEVITLLPLAGLDALREFSKQNAWVRNWFPNYPIEINMKRQDKTPWFKKMVEFVLDRDKLDDRLYRWTSSRWKRKEENGQKNIKGKIMQLQTGKHFAKSNPGSFLEKMLALYTEELRLLRLRHPGFLDESRNP
jgi:hypothetical protein